MMYSHWRKDPGIRIHSWEVRIRGSGSAPKCHGSPTLISAAIRADRWVRQAFLSASTSLSIFLISSFRGSNPSARMATCMGKSLTSTAQLETFFGIFINFKSIFAVYSFFVHWCNFQLECILYRGPLRYPAENWNWNLTTGDYQVTAKLPHTFSNWWTLSIDQSNQVWTIPMQPQYFYFK